MGTIWQQVQKIKNIYKPTDMLYAAYEQNWFQDLDLSNLDQTDPEIQLIIKYVDQVKQKKIKLDDIPPDYREKLAKLIIGDESNHNNSA